MDCKDTPNTGTDEIDWNDPMFSSSTFNDNIPAGSPFGQSAFNDFTNMSDYSSSPAGLVLRMPSKASFGGALGSDSTPGAHNPSTLQNQQSMAYTSTESSSQDSASDTSSRRKRKGTSSESPTVDAVQGGAFVKKEHDSMVGMDTGNGVKLQNYDNFSQPMHHLSLQHDMGVGDHDMFNFNSAGSSPINPGQFDAALSLDAQVNMPMSNFNTGYNQESPVQTINPATFTLGGSRDQSPAVASNMFDNASPNAVFSTPSSDSNEAYNAQYHSNTTMNQNPSWPAEMNNQFTSPGALQLTPSPHVNGATPHGSKRKSAGKHGRSGLHIAPISTKSRVETQINVIMTLEKPPLGTEYLHLPLHTIAKSKLLAKEEIEWSTTLELHTMLVCTSAMRDPALKAKALHKATMQKNSEVQKRAEAQRELSDEEKNETKNIPEEDKPSNGGEVRICNNCIQRERKRAGRKKLKKEEEQQHWERFETERVVVFNSNEYLAFKTYEVGQPQPPREQPPGGANIPHDDYIPPEGSMQVTAAMRIACYCRHQSEKEGFRVIFTMKDQEGNVVAQEMSDSILITDDHKTHPPSFSTTAMAENGMIYQPPGIFLPGHHGGIGGLQTSYSMVDLQGLANAQPGFPASRSAGNLQALAYGRGQVGFNPHSHVHQLPNSGYMSQGTSTTMTPTSLSRPGSPSSAGQSGPNKKRKSSSFHRRVPSGLTMTPRVDTSQAAGAGGLNSGMSLTSPFSPTSAGFSGNTDQSYMTIPSGNGTAQIVSSQPSTPQNEQGPTLFQQGTSAQLRREHTQQVPDYYQSLPGSRVGSRAPSPVSQGRPNLAGYARQQMHAPNAVNQVSQRFPQQVAVPGSSGTDSDATALPMIHKLTPTEGPTAGGTEVSIYGRNFTQGMQVYFGDQAATGIAFYGDQSMLCVSPPGRIGAVHVTLVPAGQHPNYSPSHAIKPIFHYKNSNERMMEMALRFVSQQQTGNANQWYQLAQNHASQFMIQNVGRAGLQHGQQAYDGGNMMAIGEPAALEDLVLKLFDTVDMSESPLRPQYDRADDSGVTMLSLACSIGLHRVVAALLARGANPDMRDRGGYTPLMHAALQGRERSFHLLVVKGADPSIRSLQGYTAVDVAPKEERPSLESILLSTPRTRSVRPSLPSRRSTGSFASSKASWDISSASFYESENEGSERLHLSQPPSRRPSASDEGPTEAAQQPHAAPDVQPNMLAWRDALAAQIHYFQQHVHHGMASLHLPTLPPLPDYQDSVRRLGSLGNVFSSPQTPSGVPPPSYSELFPESTGDMEVKKAALRDAFVDAAADQQCASLFDLDKEAGSSSSYSAVARTSAETKKTQHQRRLVWLWMPLRGIITSVAMHLLMLYIPTLTTPTQALTPSPGMVPFV